jgi:hypothetical protein
MRRAGEREGAYVDLFGPGLFAIVLGLFLLNVLDAFFTLLYLARGGMEANPIAAALIRWGIVPFLVVKCFGIGLALAFLSIHRFFRLGRIGLGAGLGLYASIFVYHVLLFFDML